MQLSHEQVLIAANKFVNHNAPIFNEAKTVLCDRVLDLVKANKVSTDYTQGMLHALEYFESKADEYIRIKGAQQ